MFRILVLIIILFHSSLVYGQGDFQKTLPAGDDYSEWLSESLSKLSTQLSLVQLKDTKKGLHYRVWFEGQVIDISSDSENTVEGSLTNFANKSSYMKKAEVESYSTKEKIETVELEQLFDLLTEYESIDYQNIWHTTIWEIDSVKLLFIIECSSAGNYSFKEVWIPKAAEANQNEIMQAKQFADSCNELLDLSKKFDSFFADLPDACYVTSVHTFLCKNDEKSNTTNEWLLSKQPIDSMIVYLNEKDWGFMATKNDWVLFNHIIVFFNKKGKIKKVKYEIQSGTIYNDDLYSNSIKKLKKQVKRVLLNLDFSLFEPPESYIVKISLTFNSSDNLLIWGHW